MQHNTRNQIMKKTVLTVLLVLAVMISANFALATPYFLDSQLEKQGLSVISETSSPTEWLPVLNSSLDVFEFTICNVPPSGFPIFDNVHRINIETQTEKCN